MKTARPAVRLPRPAPWLALLLLSGCISYRLDRLPPATGLPAPPAPDQRVSLELAVHVLPGTDMQSSSGDFPELLPVDANSELAGVLTRTGWFREVRQAPKEKAREGEAPPAPADLVLDVVVTTRANGVVLIASACMLFIIPTWRTVEYEVVAEVRAADGRWRRYRFEDAARDAHWIPLALVMSWWPWAEVYRDVRVNLYDHLLEALQRDGFLERPAR